MIYYFGADPGASGGLAALSSAGQVYTLPLKDLEPMRVWEWLAGFGELSTRYATMELVTGYIPGREGMAHGGQPGSHMFNFGRSVGVLIGLLTAAAIPFEEVRPQTWQKYLGIVPRNRKGGETQPQFKARLKDFAQGLYPSVKLTLGTCDSLLLAHYCKLNYEAYHVNTSKTAAREVLGEG